jgi:hypothetical protein
LAETLLSSPATLYAILIPININPAIIAGTRNHNTVIDKALKINVKTTFIF